MKRVLAVLMTAVVVVGIVGCGRWAESRVCGEDEGLRLFAAAGVDAEGLDMGQACREDTPGLTGGILWYAVAAGDADVVKATGKSAAHAAGEGLVVEGIIDWVDPFNVPQTPPGGEWVEGNLLGFSDRYHYDDKYWQRQVAWGRDLDGQGRYLIRVTMDTW